MDLDQLVVNLPEKNIKTIRDLFNWLDLEIGLDTEICSISLGNHLSIYNKFPTSATTGNYNITFLIDLFDRQKNKA